MKLYTREEVKETDALVGELLEAILTIMDENTGHLSCRASPICRRRSRLPWPIIWALILRCSSGITCRLLDIYERMNYCPLGSGALAGTTYPLDREYTAKLLGFDGPTLNSMDAVSDRDYLMEFLAALSIIDDASEPVLRGDHYLEHQ